MTHYGQNLPVASQDSVPPRPRLATTLTAPAIKGRRAASVSIARARNDLLHHHVRLALDALLVERLRLDDEISEAIAEVNKLGPRRHYSIGAAWKLHSRTRGETFLIPTGPHFHINRVLRNGDRYISYLPRITIEVCRRSFLRVYYGRLKRLERKIRALASRRQEANDRLSVARRQLSLARRYALRRRTLKESLGLQDWLNGLAGEGAPAVGGVSADTAFSRFLKRLERSRRYIVALHAAVVEDLRFLYRRRMELERAMDRLADVVYGRRVVGGRHLCLLWRSETARSGLTFKNPRGPDFAIMVKNNEGRFFIRVDRISRAACKNANQLRHYDFFKRLEKRLKRFRQEFEEINRRLDVVRRRLKVIPRKPKTQTPLKRS